MANQNPNLPVNVVANTQQAIRQIEALSRIPVNINFKTRGNQPLGRIVGDVSEFNKSLEAANARVVAFGASAISIFAVEQAIRSAFSAFVDLEKKLKDINILMNLTPTELQSFSSSLFDIAGRTGQSFETVSQAATEFSRQGLGVDETLKRTQDALILTRLSGLDAAKSVDALTAAINSFQNSALTSTDVVNKFASVDAAFAVSSADLAEAISRVGSSADDAGISMDQLIALVTAAQQTTARGGSVIGNAFKTIFTRLQRSKVAEILEGVGVSTVDTNGGTKTTIQLLQDLANVYDKLAPVQKSYVAEQAAGVFQINILKATLGSLSQGYSVYQNALQRSVNSTDEAIKRNEELNKTIDALAKSAAVKFQQIGATLGAELFGPTTKNVLETVNVLLSGITSVDSESFGGKIGEGLIKGIGSFISGPGALLISIVIAKLFGQFVKFARDSFNEILGLNSAAKEQANIQASITQLLKTQPGLIEKVAVGEISMVSAAKSLLAVIQQQTKALEAQQVVATGIASIISKNITTQVIGGAVVPVTKQQKPKASGFLPKASGYISERSPKIIGNSLDSKVIPFASGLGLTSGDISGEIIAAKEAGYKTPLKPEEVRKKTIDGEKITYNTREKLIKGGSAGIIPPKTSKAYKEKKEEFSDLASGKISLISNIHNFANSSANKYTDIISNQNKTTNRNKRSISMAENFAKGSYTSISDDSKENNKYSKIGTNSFDNFLLKENNIKNYVYDEYRGGDSQILKNVISEKKAEKSQLIDSNQYKYIQWAANYFNVSKREAINKITEISKNRNAAKDFWFNFRNDFTSGTGKIGLEISNSNNPIIFDDNGDVVQVNVESYRKSKLPQTKAKGTLHVSDRPKTRVNASKTVRNKKSIYGGGYIFDEYSYNNDRIENFLNISEINEDFSQKKYRDSSQLLLDQSSDKNLTENKLLDDKSKEQLFSEASSIDSNDVRTSSKISKNILISKKKENAIGGHPVFVEHFVEKKPLKNKKDTDIFSDPTEKTIQEGDFSKKISASKMLNISKANNSVTDAIEREKKAGLPISKIYVKSNNLLENASNPLGLGIFNTRDEGSNYKENFAILEKTKKKKIAASGYIGNFANNDYIKNFADPINIDKESANIFGDVAGIGTVLASILFTFSFFDKNFKKESSESLEIYHRNAIETEKKFNNVRNILDRSITKLQSFEARPRPQTEKQSIELDKQREKVNKLQTESALKQAQHERSEFELLNAQIALDKKNSLAARTRRFLKGNALGIGFGAQIAGSIGSQFFNQETKGGRVGAAISSGVGNIVGLTGAGATFGGAPGAIGGLIIGSLLELPKIISSITDRMPDLVRAVEESTSRLQRMNDASAQFNATLQKFSDIVSTGNIKGNPELIKIESSLREQANNIAEQDPRIFQQLVQAIQSGNVELAQKITQQKITKEQQKNQADLNSVAIEKAINRINILSSPEGIQAEFLGIIKLLKESISKSIITEENKIDETKISKLISTDFSSQLINQLFPIKELTGGPGGGPERLGINRRTVNRLEKISDTSISETLLSNVDKKLKDDLSFLSDSLKISLEDLVGIIKKSGSPENFELFLSGIKDSAKTLEEENDKFRKALENSIKEQQNFAKSLSQLSNIVKSTAQIDIGKLLSDITLQTGRRDFVQKQRIGEQEFAVDFSKSIGFDSPLLDIGQRLESFRFEAQNAIQDSIIKANESVRTSLITAIEKRFEGISLEGRGLSNENILSFSKMSENITKLFSQQQKDGRFDSEALLKFIDSLEKQGKETGDPIVQGLSKEFNEIRQQIKITGADLINVEKQTVQAFSQNVQGLAAEKLRATIKDSLERGLRAFGGAANFGGFDDVIVKLREAVSTRNDLRKVAGFDSFFGNRGGINVEAGNQTNQILLAIKDIVGGSFLNQGDDILNRAIQDQTNNLEAQFRSIFATLQFNQPELIGIITDALDKIGGIPQIAQIQTMQALGVSNAQVPTDILDRFRGQAFQQLQGTDFASIFKSLSDSFQFSTDPIVSATQNSTVNIVKAIFDGSKENVQGQRNLTNILNDINFTIQSQEANKEIARESRVIGESGVSIENTDIFNKLSNSLDRITILLESQQTKIDTEQKQGINIQQQTPTQQVQAVTVNAPVSVDVNTDVATMFVRTLEEVRRKLSEVENKINQINKNGTGQKFLPNR